MTVSIDIDLDAMDAIQEIAGVKMALESLDEDLDIDLELDGDLGDALDDLTETMGELTDDLTKDLNETVDRLEGLEFDDVLVSEGNGDSGGDTGSDSGDDNSMSRMRRMFETWDRSPKEMLGRMGGLDDGDGLNLGIDRDWDTNIDDFELNTDFSNDGFQAFDRNTQEILGRMGLRSAGEDSRVNKRMVDGFSFLGGDGSPNILPPDGKDRIGGGGSVGMLRQKNLSKIDGLLGSVRKSFKKTIPSMSTWLNIIGALVPVLGAVAIQALGVASAMGAMAVAGGAMIGLGLLGHGDTMAESFRNAKEEVGELKKALFEEFEPAADKFGGIQKEFFDFIPKEMGRISNSMEGLTAFKEDIFRLFRGGTEFASEFIDSIVNNAGAISQLTHRFSGLVGSSILDLFSWLLIVGERNQNMLVRLGVAFKEIAITVYNLFTAVSRALAMMAPFFGILVGLSKLLNNSLISGMIAISMVMWLASAAASSLTASFLGMGITLMSTTIPILGAWIAKLSAAIFWQTAAIVGNWALAQSITAVTMALLGLAAVSGIGLLLSGAGVALAGGMSGSIPGNGNSPSGYDGRGGGGSTIVNEGDTVNVNVGNTDNSTVEKFADLSGSRSRDSVDGSYTS